MLKKIFSLIGASGRMAVTTGVSRILGYIRTATLAHLFGVGGLADSFFLAFKFPNLFRRLFAEGAMSAAFIPIFSKLKDDRATAQLFFSRVFTLLALALTLFCGLALWQAENLLSIFYSLSNTKQSVATAVPLMRIMFPYLFFISLTAILQGTHNAHQKFVLPALTPVLFNLSMIGFSMYAHFYIQDPLLQSHYVAWGVFAGGVVQCLFLLPSLYKLGYFLRFSLDFRDKNIKRFFTLMLPVAFSSGIYQFNHFLPDIIALGLEDGALSALQYSVRLQELPLGVIVISITAVSLPLFSDLRNQGKFETLVKSYNHRFLQLTFLLLPISCIILLSSKSIVTVVFNSGKFDQTATDLTAACLAFHGLSLLPIAWMRITQTLFFAYQDTKTPLIVALFSLLVNVFFAYLLGQFFGLGAVGIAIASVITNALIYLSLYVSLAKHLTTRTFKTHFLPLIALVSVATLAYFLIDLITPYLHTWSQDLFHGKETTILLKVKHFISFLLNSISYSLIYLFFCYTFKLSPFKLLKR